MAKIIKTVNEVVSVGTDDGGIRNFNINDLNFDPEIGDEVKIDDKRKQIKLVRKYVDTIPIKKTSISENKSQVSLSKPVYISGKLKGIKKTNYCLLIIFFGGIGIHKFYIGKITLGLLYLIFCWTLIPWVLSIIDLIIAIQAKTDIDGNIII